MGKLNIKKSSLAVLALISSAIATGQNLPSSVPAQFTDDEKFIGNLIRFPKVNQDFAIAIKCLARLNKRGRITDNHCFVSDQLHELGFDQVIRRAARSAEFIPAKINGKREPVQFIYMVQFIQQGGEKEINVFLHQGNNIDEFGLEYIAAQRYEFRMTPMTCRHRNLDTVVVSSVDVAADGSVTLPENTSESETTDGCHTAFNRHLLVAHFIPAMLNGEFVASRYIEPFWDF